MIYIIVILTALFQATLAGLIAIGNIRPDLLLILVVFMAIRKGPLNAAVIGAAAGFLKDILSTGAFLNTLAFPICGIAIGLFVQRFYQAPTRRDWMNKEKVFREPAIVLAASVFISFVYLAWFSQWNYPPSIAILAVRVGIPTVLYTALAAPPVFFALNKLF